MLVRPIYQSLIYSDISDASRKVRKKSFRIFETAELGSETVQKDMPLQDEIW